MVVCSSPDSFAIRLSCFLTEDKYSADCNVSTDMFIPVANVDRGATVAAKQCHVQALIRVTENGPLSNRARFKESADGAATKVRITYR